MAPKRKVVRASKKTWKQACLKRFNPRIVVGYLALFVLTPAFIINNDAWWCLAVCMLTASWTLLRTVPLAAAWMLPILILPLAGVCSIAYLADLFIEDSFLLLLIGLNVLVVASEQTSLSSRIALRLIEASGLRLWIILLGTTLVAFIAAQLLAGSSAALLMSAVVEATMFELQHDIIAATITQRRRPKVRTTVGDGLVMTPVQVMFISPRRSTSSTPEEEELESEEEDSQEVEIDMRPCVLVPASSASFNGRIPGAYYQLHGGLPDDPRLIVGVDAAAPEIEENEDNKDQPKAPCILRHRNTAKMFLLEAHRLQKIKKALLINVANGSAVGCMANILGSISGIYLRDYFHGAYGYDAVTALSWTLVGLPVAGVSLFLSGFITYFLFLRPYDIREDTETLKIINGIISKKRKFLGGLTWKEALLGASMIVIFIMCIAIKFITVLLGLGEHIYENEHESLNVFLVLLLVSLLPNASNSEPLFDWRHVPERISWRTVLTIGGGFALTGVIESVGLSRCLAEQIIKLHFLSPLQTQLVLILLTALLIEINANVVIARLLIPIAADIGILTKVHPLYYALAVAMASCTPAVLPTAAPSIAIVTSAMDVDIGDTLYPGLAVKLATILLVLASVNIGGEALFSWNELPAWVQQAHRDRRSKGSACTALANHTSLPDIFSISSAYSVY